MLPPIRAAACHVSPVFLSARRTTDKCISLIHQAAKNKANLVVFPETYIPAFPAWSSLRPPTGNHDLFARMAAESIYIDGEEMRDIRAAAKQANTIVSLGISEKVRHSSGCLYNTNVMIGADGEVLNHHRKLVPTFFEKLTWSPGDGHGLRVIDTPYGKIGNLICGENTNPLARYALMAQGEQLHISTWPAIWPTRVVSKGSKSPDDTATKAGTNYDNVTANRTRAAAHCFEAKCFGILCAGRLNPEAIEIMSQGSSCPTAVTEVLTQSPNGATMFLDPTGALLPGLTVGQDGTEKSTEYLQMDEDVLYADMGLDDCVEGKQYHGE